MNAYIHTITQRIADLAVYREERRLPQELTARTAGRILSLRSYRSILFFDIHEDGHYIQCAIRQSQSPEAFAYFQSQVSRGNIVNVSGLFGTTQTGEVTLFVESIHLISQNLELIGDLYDGFAHGRQRRELDLMLNPSSMHRFQQRSRITQSIRHYFYQRDFLEVETPILQASASGAQATPFTTRLNATQRDAYLRIAPETYLVRLLVGGMSRIFELGHNFRNEGMSPRHNPEFSMLEFYETYRNLNDTMRMTRELLLHAITQTGLNPQSVPYGDMVLDFTNMEELTVQESLIRYLGMSTSDTQDIVFLQNYLRHHNVSNTMPSESVAWLQYLVFEYAVEPLLIQPTFITNLPVEASPLAYSEDGATTTRFEMFCAGREIANGFQQVISYDEQVERFAFQAQISGRDAAMQADEDYMHAVRYGMPTLSGCGIGIDRLVMLLTNAQNIRDIILYPM